MAEGKIRARRAELMASVIAQAQMTAQSDYSTGMALRDGVACPALAPVMQAKKLCVPTTRSSRQRKCGN